MNEIDFDKFPDSAVISVTKEEMLEILSVSTMAFIKDLQESAKANWCESQSKDLNRLINSVIKDVPYCEASEDF